VTSLDLGLIGNGSIGALIDADAAVVWCCFPRFDGDPVFCSLLNGGSAGAKTGAFTIELEGGVTGEQHYLHDTPILVTRLHDGKGGGVEITDFCPRYEKDGSLYCPKLLVRQVRPIGGNPNIVVRVEPADDEHARWRDRDAEFVVLDFGGDCNLHAISVLSKTADFAPVCGAIPRIS